jgi:hypothetical protein
VPLDQPALVPVVTVSWLTSGSLNITGRDLDVAINGGETQLRRYLSWRSQDSTFKLNARRLRGPVRV